MAKKKLPLPVAVLWIIGSVISISGSFYMAKKWAFSGKNKKFDPGSEIVSILQTGPEKQALSSVYLAQLMELSIDKPTFIEQFDCERAQKQLLTSPLIKEVKVEKIKPSTIFVDYTIRKPIARLIDFENLAVDEEGVTFPLFPFIPPRYLPEVYLGISKVKGRIEGEGFELSKKILSIIQEESAFSSLELSRVDVSQAEASSYGRRELVVIFKSTQFSRSTRYLFTYLLRLSPSTYLTQLENFLTLRHSHLLPKESDLIQSRVDQQELVELPISVIDLRIKDLAYIQ